MSDLCMYELEGIVWDDFSQWYEVPHPGNKHACGNSSQHDRHMRAGGDVSFVAVANSEEKATQETWTPCNELNKTLRKEGWYQKPGLEFCLSCNSKSVNQGPSSVTGGSKISQSTLGAVGGELCASDSIRDKSGAVGSSFGCPLDNMTDVNNDLKFFDNNHEDMDSSDFLYYGWPDVGSFEDVDQMFGSCDSTFGLGSRNDLDSLDGCGGSKRPCPESSKQRSIAANVDASRLSCMSGPTNKSNVKSPFVLCQGDSCSLADDELSGLGYFSFSNGSGVSDGEDDCIPERQNQDGRIENDQSKKFVCIDNMSESVGDQVPNVDSGHYLSFQSDTPYNHPSDQDSMHSTLPAAKSENSELTLLSLKDSYMMNQGKSHEVSNDPSFQGTSSKPIDKREIQYQQECLTDRFNDTSKDVDLAVQASLFGTTKKANVVYFSCEEKKDHAEDGGADVESPGELSSATRERSSMCSGSDDASEESTRFSQLQLVMERLDSSVKICIRDSLYHLAWSAEQRHNSSTLSGGIEESKDAPGVLFTDGTDRYTYFTDRETETNRIDRLMAHLLFHKPGDSSVIPAQSCASFN